LERSQLQKKLGAALDKNMLQAALGKKLCLEQRQLKKLLGPALEKNMLGATLDKRYAWSGASQKNCWVLR